MTKFDLLTQSPYVGTKEHVAPVTERESSTVAPPLAPASWPLLPWARGPLSEAIIAALQSESRRLDPPPEVNVQEPLRDDDFQLALYLCYAAQQRDRMGLDGEWDVNLFWFRAHLENIFMTRLREVITPRFHRRPFDVASEINQLIFASQRISVSSYFVNNGTLDQFREFCAHQSVSQLRENGLTAPAVSRPFGEASTSSSQLFAATMSALGLDPSYGSYVEMLPGVTLATSNLASMFQLHRKWRAELVGLRAVSEMTSGSPMERYGHTLERFGVGPEGRAFFESHLSVDARTAEIARRRMTTGLLSTDPECGDDVLFGAAATLLLEENFSRHLLDSWVHQRSSLVPWEMNS